MFWSIFLWLHITSANTFIPTQYQTKESLVNSKNPEKVPERDNPQYIAAGCEW